MLHSVNCLCLLFNISCLSETVSYVSDPTTPLWLSLSLSLSLCLFKTEDIVKAEVTEQES